MAANLLYPPGSSLSPEVLTSFVLPAHNQCVSYAPIRGLAPWKIFLPTTGSFFVLLITCNTDRDFVFHHRIDDREFTLDTRELRGILGEEVELNVPDVVAWMRDFLKEQTESIKGEKI